MTENLHLEGTEYPLARKTAAKSGRAKGTAATRTRKARAAKAVKAATLSQGSNNEVEVVEAEVVESVAVIAKSSSDDGAAQGAPVDRGEVEDSKAVALTKEAG